MDFIGVAERIQALYYAFSENTSPFSFHNFLEGCCVSALKPSSHNSSSSGRLDVLLYMTHCCVRLLQEFMNILPDDSQCLLGLSPGCASWNPLSLFQHALDSWNFQEPLGGLFLASTTPPLSLFGFVGHPSPFSMLYTLQHTDFQGKDIMGKEFKIIFLPTIITQQILKSKSLLHLGCWDHLLK